MSRKYRPLSERAKAQHGEDVVELDLSPLDELDAVRGGDLEIVPSRYQVLVENFAHGDKEAVYVAAMYAEMEDALIGGGVLKRVEDELDEKPPAKKAAAKKATAKKKSDD